MSFTVTIETGNDAMCEPGHVGEQLRRIADSLDGGFTSGPVVDLNGNTVGSFDYSSGDDDAVLGNCEHGVNLDRDFCPEGCRR